MCDQVRGDPGERQPHAALQPAGRWPKAEKIRRLVALSPPPDRRLRVLEIGTGSGAIAHYFAVRSGLDCEVDAVDVIDQRQIKEGYRFQQIGGVSLPFETGVFDLVISNHVIEHVGGHDQQQQHLCEMERVLRVDGRGYLACPNRWQVVEPHFRLAFLSWLPRNLRDPYLRLCGKGAFYDCEPLRMSELERMLAAARFDFRNACVPAIRMMLHVERHRSIALRIVGKLPDAWLEHVRSICPTHIYLLTPHAGAGG